MNIGPLKNKFLFLFLFLICSSSYACEYSNFTDIGNKPLNSNKILSLDIKIIKSKSWNKNIFNIYKSLNKSETINKKFKKKYKANLIIEYENNIKCKYQAKIRTVGLSSFHFSKENFLTSIEVKLLNGNIKNITKFRLLLPQSRLEENEIFLATLLEEVGIITPKTFYIKTKINNRKQKFIFQETFDKELLERHNFREGPIYVISNNHRNDKLIKVSNSSWIKNDIEKFKVSMRGLQLLNHAFSVGTDDLLIDEKYYENKVNFVNFKLFNSIMSATNSFHGFGIANRVIYFNPIKEEFFPIYNDGKSRILNEENLADNNFVESFNGLMNRSVDSAYARQKLLSIDLDDFLRKLNTRGFKTNKSFLEKKIEFIIERLDFMEANKAPKDNNKVNSSVKLLDGKRKIYIEINNLDYQIFECYGDNSDGCIIKDLYEKISFKKKINKYHDLKYLLSQDTLDDKHVFLGDKKAKSNFTYNNYFKYSKNIDNYDVYFNNLESIFIDEDKKTIRLNQKDALDKILISGKEIKNWKIKFQGKNNFKDLNINNNNLTGCVTLYEINIIDIEIETTGGLCEDTINIVRSKGKIQQINTNKSYSDAVDIDFSNLIINQININESQNDCLDLSFGNYNIKELNVKNCGDKGISVGEQTTAKINELNSEISKIGIASKDSSITKVGYAKIKDVKTCVTAYKKKQEFDGAYLSIDKFDCKRFDIIKKSDKYSKILIN